jgi:adenine-specific DNA-methyltransferase
MPTLDWLHREAAFRTAQQVPTRVLRPHAAGHRFGSADAAPGNLLVQGDNLQALKALLPFYRGQVKCIFIDPPYNTKSAFEHYDDNLEHSQWLSMMLPRLQLLREFLREDGSIWVTIDDHEGHYLKVLMDEVFGRGNFVATIAWQKVFAKKNKAQISGSHDHVLVFARSAAAWTRNLLPRSGSALAAFKNPDGDPRGRWQSVSYSVQSEDAEKRSAYRYEITLPSGREVLPPAGRHWNGLPQRTAELRAANRLWFGADGDSPPRLKVFLSEVQDGIVPDTWWTHEMAGSNQNSKKELVDLFPGVEPFGTPKPELLLSQIVAIATNPGDLILDSFLGSGTTAAVAHKMGRRWIGIEMGEHAVTHCLPRLQKVVQGEQGGISQAVNWQGGGGFRFVQLGAPLFDEHGELHPEVRFADLAAFLWLRETGTAYEPAASPVQGTPLLGVHEGRAVYLLYNGILGDKRPAAGNVLTSAVLAAMQARCWHEGPKVVYGEACLLGDARLHSAGISFRQLPHAVPR